jgi:putative ABC transport system permease protein
MNFLESIRISWRAITGHKLRSALTTLGIIIGIAAVIAFQVLGGGLQEDLLGDIEADQDPIITVQTQQEQEFGQQPVSTPIYTQTDVERIENLSGVEFVSPQARVPATELQYEDTTLRATLGGQDLFGVAAARPSLFETSLFEITNGTALSEGTNETVVNEGLANRLGEEFGVGDQITLQINGTRENFTVAGIVDDGDAGPVPDTAYVPIEPYYATTTETPRGTEELAYPGLVVGAEDFDQLESTKQEITEYFESDSDAGQLLAETDDEELAITVQTIEDILDQFSDILDQITLFLGGIAAISLLVGSIGIANIMIVSVTERTREIGVMKAVGAKKRDVIQLFLVEALILGIIGAIFGVLVGLGFGYLGVSWAGWPMVYPLDWMTIAVAVGVIVGVVSGIYPAWRAARVDPIEALRRE